MEETGLPRWLKFGLIGCGGLVVLGMLLFVVLVVGITMGSNNKQSGSTADSTTAEQDPPPKKKAPPKKNTQPGNVDVGVNETAKLDDRTLVVNEAERNYAPPTRFTRVEPGNELVRVYITLENTSNQPFNYNLNDFRVQDSNGVQKPPETITELPYRISYGDLAPDGTLEGNMVFQVPQGDSGLKLVYTTDVVSKRTVTVTL